MEQMASDENGHPDAALRQGKGETFLAVCGLLAAALTFANVIWGDEGYGQLAFGFVMLGAGLVNVAALRSRFLRPIRWIIMTAFAVFAYQLVASWL